MLADQKTNQEIAMICNLSVIYLLFLCVWVI